MPINCDLFLHWNATPGQLTALGGALWDWCQRTAGDTGIYRRLDSQLLADLIAGRFPAPAQTPPQSDRSGFRVRIRDESSHHRRATVASLRREIPVEGIENILVDGTSWNESDGLPLLVGGP